MPSESATGIQSDLLETLRASDIRISCKITEVRLEKARATTRAIKPISVGEGTVPFTHLTLPVTTYV
mgnify:CR=1 FL=1